MNYSLAFFAVRWRAKGGEWGRWEAEGPKRGVVVAGVVRRSSGGGGEGGGDFFHIVEGAEGEGARAKAPQEGGREWRGGGLEGQRGRGVSVW